MTCGSAADVATAIVVSCAATIQFKGIIEVGFHRLWFARCGHRLVVSLSCSECRCLLIVMRSRSVPWRPWVLRRRHCTRTTSVESIAAAGAAGCAKPCVASAVHAVQYIVFVALICGPSKPSVSWFLKQHRHLYSNGCEGVCECC